MINAVFNSVHGDRITELIEASGSRDAADVVCKALAIYELVIREVSVGATVLIRDVTGNLRPITIR